MYPRWMLILLHYFDLWGFCTQVQKSQTVYRIILICHIIIATFVTLTIIVFMGRPVGDNLGVFNDSLKLYTHLIINWIPIIELYLKHRIQRKFWKIMHNIDKEFCSHQYLCFKSYLIKIILFFILLIAMFLNYLLCLHRSELITFWFSFIFIVSFCKNYFFYYLFYLEFIKYELKMVYRETKLMSCYCERCTLKSSKTFLKKFYCNRFKWIRKYYGSIYDLCDIINTVFGWSNVFAIPMSFLLILADINWFYWKLYNKYRVDMIGKFIKLRKIV